MATVNLMPANLAKMLTGGPPPRIELPEAASQTFKKGEYVYLVSGYVTEVGDNPAVILGMAEEDAHNDTSAGTHDVGVVLAHDDVMFCANKVNSSGVAVVTAVTDRGQPLSLYRDTVNNKSHVYTGVAGENHRFICVDMDHRDAIGDTGGRLLFQVLAKFRQLTMTS